MAQTLITTVTAGSDPVAIAFNPATNKIYVVNQNSNNVTVIDGVTYKTNAVAAGAAPNALAINSVTNKIYVVNGSSASITVINGANNSTASVAVGDYPIAVAVNTVTNKIYVANYYANNVTVIDGATNHTTTVTTGIRPTALAVNPATNKIYVADFGSETLTIIDGATNSTTSVGVGSYPLAIAINQYSNNNFTGGDDGALPYAGLTMDPAGNLYGTTENGGRAGFGTVFKLAHKGSGWVLNPLYSFQGGSDGRNPQARVTIAPNGTLYGTTSAGGVSGCSNGCGTIFHLSPPPTACTSALCPWTETVIYSFNPNIGGQPGIGSLVIDQLGNLYGTELGNQHFGFGGDVYELAYSNGQWTFDPLYTFISGETSNPTGGVIFDDAGNLYGTSGGAAFYNGAAFELTPEGQLWTENTLWGFCLGGGNDGANPGAAVAFDQLSNLYGTTGTTCMAAQGTVYELMKQSNGTWTESVLHFFSGSDGDSPSGTLTFDSAGNLYGTTDGGGQHGLGTVFNLSPSGGQWILTDLHDFDGADGSQPLSSNVVLDANGNLYGTASQGGVNGQGVVWEITP